jgi:hypothetical protein
MSRRWCLTRKRNANSVAILQSSNLFAAPHSFDPAVKMPSALPRTADMHVGETVVLIASACSCMSAIHALVVALSWTAYAVGAAAIAVALLLPLRFARMLAPAPYGASTSPAERGRRRIMAVLGTGGHTSEMILLLKNLDRSLCVGVVRRRRRLADAAGPPACALFDSPALSFESVCKPLRALLQSRSDSGSLAPAHLHAGTRRLRTCTPTSSAGVQSLRSSCSTSSSSNSSSRTGGRPHSPDSAGSRAAAASSRGGCPRCSRR